VYVDQKVFQTGSSLLRTRSPETAQSDRKSTPIGNEFRFLGDNIAGISE